MQLQDILKKRYNKEINNCTNEEIYYGILEMINNIVKKENNKSKKKLYYLSAEFLIGKLLSNNLINLGLYNEVNDLLVKNGKSINEIEEIETEPSLGNGGLGRLASCFLDSVATLGLNGDGIGINYHFGLFRQKFINNKQNEFPDKWIEKTSWLNKTSKEFTVKFKDYDIKAIMYDINIIGYKGVVNKLHLFDLSENYDYIVKDNINFDKSDIQKNLSLFLYPDDSDEKGKLLRLYQQYFMVSCGAELILNECIEKGSNLYDLDSYAVIQINDTHPSLIIPELIRRLEEKGVSFKDAVDIVSKVCAYTNHTILAEALEKWSIDSLKKVVPFLVPVIEKLSLMVKEKYNDEKLNIIDKNNMVHMARMDIHYSFSINGVARLHTKILKEIELKDFYKIYPYKFNNKTNGITFRRWLVESNHLLTKYLVSLIGSGFITNGESLKELEKFKDDEKVINKLLDIKKTNKTNLIGFLNQNLNLRISENAITDVHIKRFHEYKRQQLNALYYIYKYLEIKKGKIPPRPVCAIFGGKAAPSYIAAKDIIHLVLCLAQVVNNDQSVNEFLNIVIVENYNVTLAEKIIPGADISEQISLASKEASGTGNMKFMLNGALTLGTEDGANIEIKELAGEDNIYIFGEKSDTVVRLYNDGSYRPNKYIEENKILKECIDFITSDEMLKVGDRESLERIKKELTDKDYFMALLDFESYRTTKNKMLSDYEDKMLWGRKMLLNISNSGYFSSDRTVKDYNKEIWRLK